MSIKEDLLNITEEENLLLCNILYDFVSENNNISNENLNLLLSIAEKFKRYSEVRGFKMSKN